MVKAPCRSSTLDPKLNIKAHTCKAWLPPSSVLTKTHFEKICESEKDFFLLSVPKINFYRHIKSTVISSDISEMSSSTLIHFLIWFITETKQRRGIGHWAVKRGIHICTASSPCTAPAPLQTSPKFRVFLLETIIKEAMREISIYTFLALLTDFINHSAAK